MTSTCTIVPASEAGIVSAVRQMFIEYAASIGVDLCFQNFDQELAGLPGNYTPEKGGQLFLAKHGGETVGCVAMQRIDDTVCEMKRMYVRPACRGRRVGRLLAEAIINEARQKGYTHMRLDTLPSMEAAIALYHTLGFYEIDPYRHNPIPGAKYMELDLR